MTSSAPLVEIRPTPHHRFKKVRSKPVSTEAELKEFTDSMLSKGYVCGWLGMGAQPHRAIAVVEVFKHLRS